ncbi:MAG: hypothetical protein FJ279_31040 [Planctomycetes bacterium]|nr:hypothetical protein [Planctomycetota bacterium]MBM4082679.1 hypothetical protein [Planctomycetota bacterium]
MSLYWPLPNSRRNPFSSRKRVSGRLVPAKQAAEDGGLSGHMRILDIRYARIRVAIAPQPDAG